MSLSKSAYKILTITFNMAATAILFAGSNGTPENPYDPHDTSGIPALYIYITLLFIFTVFSALSMVCATLINRLLNDRPPKTLIFIFELLPSLTTAALGTLIALAYSNSALPMYMAALTYMLSFISSLAATGLFRKIHRSAPDK
ncbi:hypothetical protein KSS93_07950 [Pseudomonas xanthosomatis]|uniref:hypothetical protein n=1 Tax=Pseudomonas xanthosomatis TaxID=2842356 RepID=UPI001C3E5417|nr:hypothetical protein [Pseudomonas xanthosomatis]QXH47829.1 hypothetical protein KSS93_07950 [Pseudomonas xanthosomatis]